MIYNYLGIYGDQTSQMKLCIKHVVKHHLGRAELVIERSGDLQVLANLESRLSPSDSILVSSVFQLGETALDILERITEFLQKGVKIISVAEGVLDGTISELLSAVVAEVRQGDPIITMESSRGRGLRRLLHS